MKDKDEKIIVNVEEDVKELVIRYDEAKVVKEPEILKIKGLIDSSLRFLEKRVSELDQKKCHVIIDREKFLIVLNIDEHDYYGGSVSGELKLDPVYVKFGINTNLERNTFDLADFIKMNRIVFESKQVAMNLVKELRNFEAKVNKEIEMSDDKRANTKVLAAQVVETNIPEKFVLNMPVFQGMKKQKFDVEININPGNFGCMLISPDANDTVNDVRDTAIDEQIEKIKEVAPDIVIIEQ